MACGVGCIDVKGEHNQVNKTHIAQGFFGSYR